MDTLTGFVKTGCFSSSGFSGWAATGCRLSVAYRTCKNQSQSVSWSFHPENSLATHSLTRAFGRIIVVAARAYVRDVTTAIDEQWRSTEEDKSAHISTTEVSFCRGEFLRNYYTLESVYDGDHDGVVRIFVGLSYEPGRLISYLHYVEQFFPYQECNIILHYAAQFFPYQECNYIRMRSA